jgi:hypothetical protein
MAGRRNLPAPAWIDLKDRYLLNLLAKPQCKRSNVGESTLNRIARCLQKPMERRPMGTTTLFCCFLSRLLTAFHRMYRSPSSDLNAPLQKNSAN